MFVWELMATVYQTIASEFHEIMVERGDFSDDDDDDDDGGGRIMGSWKDFMEQDKAHRPHKREVHREFLNPAAQLGVAGNGWLTALEALSNVTSNLSSTEIALYRLTADMHKMEVLYVYSSLLHEVSYRGGPQSQPNLSNQNEQTLNPMNVEAFRAFVAKFLKDIKFIQKELTKSVIVKKSSSKKAAAPTTIQKEYKNFFLHGRKEFYDSFFYWINTYLEISIIANNLEVRQFLKNHHFRILSFSISDEANKIQETNVKAWDEVLDVIEKNCLACMEIHQQLYDVKTEKTKDLETDIITLQGGLTLSAFNDRMNQDMVTIEPMIDTVMGNLKEALHGFVGANYANPPTIATSASESVANKIKMMKRQLFGKF
jgi:hypothetical protein